MANVNGRVTETPENGIDIARFSKINLLLNTTAWIIWLTITIKKTTRN